jgi:beta-glucanase (GH16 family)
LRGAFGAPFDPSFGPLLNMCRHILTLLLASLFLAACGGGSSPSDAATAAADDDSAHESGAGLVAVAALPTYTVQTGELLLDPQFAARLQYWSAFTGHATIVASELRSGGNALRASGPVTQAFAAALLQPGRSYTLKVMARNLVAGSSSVALRFRESNNGSYRTYACSVSSTSYKECRVDFTVPAYAKRADLAFLPQGVTLQVDRASLTMRAPVVNTESVTTLVGSTVPAGYALVFNDEFTGSTLKRHKWFTRYIHHNETGDRLNDEQQRYRDNGNHVLADGLLSLTARKVSSSDPAGINYESGLLRSDFTFRYGYVEARVRMPGGRGVWPAFWLASDVDGEGLIGWPPEIDIFEQVNNGVEDTMDMLHMGVIVGAGVSPAPHLYTDPAYNSTWTYWRAPYRFDAGWHTVATEWTPDSVSMFVDGKRIVTRAYKWNHADGTPAGKAHLLLNLAIGGNWAGRHGIDDSAFPQALQVNWVRVYQKSNSM